GGEQAPRRNAERSGARDGKPAYAVVLPLRMRRSTTRGLASSSGCVRMRSGVSWLTCGALGAHVALLLATTACTRTGRPVKMVWANEPGDGAVATCPEDAVDATGGLSGFGDRTPSPTQARC